MLFCSEHLSTINTFSLQISLKALEGAQNDPLFITNMELIVPSCITNPSIGEIQRCFANVIHNVCRFIKLLFILINLLFIFLLGC